MTHFDSAETPSIQPMSSDTVVYEICYIGLGSNLDNPIQHIQQALDALSRHADIELKQHSSLYRSAPVGPQDQPEFINAVAEISTHLAALPLLDILQSIENSHQRKRAVHWGPRTLDLDLLLYGNHVIDHPRLTIPHAHLFDRNFVLQPLAEINANLIFPDGSTVQYRLFQCPANTLEKLTDN